MKLFLVVVFCAALGLGVAWAGGQGGAEFGTVSVMLVCGAIAFGVNWLAFVPANIFQTEKYYDLTGSLTYLSTVGFAAYFSQPLSLRGTIVAIMVAVWAMRLGSFLYARIKKDGKDRRFDKIKTSPMRFLMTWTLQGLWVILTAACALAVITSTADIPLGVFAYVGGALWLLGFVIEVMADEQKKAFRADPANNGKFISTGVWAWSRHPNYFGEIVLWLGIAVMAVPVLSGLQWAVMISPVFVFLLLTRVSGVPKLEHHADKTWGDDPAYQEYKANTPVLMMKPPAKA